MIKISFIRLFLILCYLITLINGLKRSRRTRLCEKKYNYYNQRREELINKLREKKEKIRVCFLVSENEKWNAQSIYDMMEKSEDFYPFIVVTHIFRNKAGRASFQHNLEFFRKCGKDVEIGYDEETKSGVDLKKFNPDIVFYQQPWQIYKNQSPEYVLDFALSYYFPYGIGSVNPVLKKFWYDFYMILQKHFVFSEAEKQQCMKLCKYVESNTSVVGHPKLDNIYNSIEQNNNQKKYVIYAPHHSFNRRSLLHLGTFNWNGEFILQWAKSHPEINWVFKPHPALKNVIIRARYMKRKEIEKYYREWAKIGILYDDGNYFDLFKNSTCLITDCHSFLTEYFPTENPVIHLRNPKGTQFSLSNKVIIKTYYDVWNNTQLKNTLEDVLINGQDPKKEDRLSLLNEMDVVKENSALKIIRELKKDLWRFETIIIYGTFDFLNYEQIQLLKKAKELGKYLIVGLSTDSYNNNIKEKSFYHNYEQRKAILENCSYVDLIIPDDSWDQKISDINKYQVDVLVLENESPKKYESMYNYCESIFLEMKPKFCIIDEKRKRNTLN